MPTAAPTPLAELSPRAPISRARLQARVCGIWCGRTRGCAIAAAYGPMAGHYPGELVKGNMVERGSELGIPLAMTAPPVDFLPDLLHS